MHMYRQLHLSRDRPYANCTCMPLVTHTTLPSGELYNRSSSFFPVFNCHVEAADMRSPGLSVVCPAGNTSDETGQYYWPDTAAGQEAKLSCPQGNPDVNRSNLSNAAFRHCERSENSSTSVWSMPVTTACQPTTDFTQALRVLTQASHYKRQSWIDYCS